MASFSVKWMATVFLSVCAIVKPWLIDQFDMALMASCRRFSRAGRWEELDKELDTSLGKLFAIWFIAKENNVHDRTLP